MPTADSIAGMGGAPLDLQVYVSGDYTYYCQAIPGTWSALTDSNFRVFRLYKPGGVLSTVRYATNGVNSDGRTIG